MEQGPSDPLQDSLLPLMKALIANSLLTHSVEGVRVSVTYCLTEIMRISAPLEPFNDDQMKVIFELIVEAFSKLSQASTQYYEKVLSILETVARVKACLLMLDLQCNALVVRMFHSFWAFIRSDPADDILWAVEQIMTDILSKSEDISLGLLNPLLASVLKGNKNVSPSCWKLGERVITSCAAKLAPVLHGAVQSNGTTVDDYSPVVASICENEPTMENHHVNGSSQPVVANGVICFPGKVVPDLYSAPGFNTSDAAALLVPNDVVPVAKTSTDKADSLGSKGPTKLEIDLEALPKKREWKPNKLLNPAEGYDLSWLYVEAQKSGHRRVLVNGRDLPAAPKIPSRKRRMQQKVNVEPDAGESAVDRDVEAPVAGDLAGEKSKLSIVGGRMSNFSNAISEGSGLPGRRLVGQKIKVWWPLDKTFYDGLIQSYDPIIKKHKVLYDDGDKETLNLEKERWEFIEDNLPEEEADNPKPITAPVILTKQRGSDKSSESMKILNYNEIVKRAGAATSLPEVEAPNFSNQNIGGDGSSNDDSNDGNVFEIRARSKDVQVENPSRSTSDDSTPEASLPRAISVLSKDVQLKKPRTSTSNESTPEGSPLRPMRAKSTDVRLSSTSNDSTLEASPPRPWGLWQSQSHRY
ncbi:sister chromatid cohesion protein PDS5 homolog C-like isoform X2 [Rhodamnia argentea]|nr:sister chromatid cohesion protein PDS5 homolog C-like isoform X2 [Rhodamnia argentea]XP_048139484.1 sister chromatid cohesion protein PDS5 homolog C-like isoform X2 [Rhodamnia argentea]XP_048139485.1 sister chromatid cohesion protein PDS5 homolog C-like isoform X2 [Rhodamnia argentea]XP_048139486.1 sister chromatid cohesion protein PDS5 homolog C-like isoform X2 [Rhodamnia argentea]XP_048139487.1 sister chromatid cohesion protein PDS5 homolog C-like isoform X2 [Rhodamnia argentea]XP_0481394